MAAVRWKLADYLDKHGLTAYALAKAVGQTRMNTLYRIARRGDEPTRVDLPTLAAIIVGLRQLTGEPVDLTDILEFDPEGGEGGERKPARRQRGGGSDT